MIKAEDIKAARARLRITQKELASKAGTSLIAITKAESPKEGPIKLRVSTLKKICDFLKISMEDGQLLTEEGETS